MLSQTVISHHWALDCVRLPETENWVSLSISQFDWLSGRYGNNNFQFSTVSGKCLKLADNSRNARSERSFPKMPKNFWHSLECLVSMCDCNYYKYSPESSYTHKLSVVKFRPLQNLYFGRSSGQTFLRRYVEYSTLRFPIVLRWPRAVDGTVEFKYQLTTFSSVFASHETDPYLVLFERVSIYQYVLFAVVLRPTLGLLQRQLVS